MCCRLQTKIGDVTVLCLELYFPLATLMSSVQKTLVAPLPIRESPEIQQGGQVWVGCQRKQQSGKQIQGFATRASVGAPQTDSIENHGQHPHSSNMYGWNHPFGGAMARPGAKKKESLVPGIKARRLHGPYSQPIYDVQTSNT